MPDRGRSRAGVDPEAPGTPFPPGLGDRRRLRRGLAGRSSGAGRAQDRSHGSEHGRDPAPRTAAGEPRLAFLIANPGVADWAGIFLSKIEEISPLIGRLNRKNPAALDALMGKIGKLSPFLMWGLTDTMWKHGVSSPSAMLEDMERYGRPAGLARIACPTLIIDGEAEEYGQARSLYDELTCPKTYLRFTEEEAAPLHVQTASLALASQRIFDWIDDTLETME